ncbi:hypothetical protein PR048_016809 [Dryococelus australis]|uniref:Uncharacterized protein n=1 Tax=Dryococelus australis TaxID=614101 RepID=A0ABQ9H7U4_9NEOP|nr:hypothetical protein PR048_016809 [Dryococelus australis]
MVRGSSHPLLLAPMHVLKAHMCARVQLPDTAQVKYFEARMLACVELPDAAQVQTCENANIAIPPTHSRPPLPLHREGESHEPPPPPAKQNRHALAPSARRYGNCTCSISPVIILYGRHVRQGWTRAHVVGRNIDTASVVLMVARDDCRRRRGGFAEKGIRRRGGLGRVRVSEKWRPSSPLLDETVSKVSAQFLDTQMYVGSRGEPCHSCPSCTTHSLTHSLLCSIPGDVAQIFAVRKPVDVAISWWVFSRHSYPPHSCIPPLLHLPLISPSSAFKLITWGGGGAAARALASHHSEPGSIPCGSLSHVGIVLYDGACRRDFSWYSLFPRPCIPEPLHPRGLTSCHYKVGVISSVCSFLVWSRRATKQQQLDAPGGGLRNQQPATSLRTISCTRRSLALHFMWRQDEDVLLYSIRGGRDSQITPPARTGIKLSPSPVTTQTCEAHCRAENLSHPRGTCARSEQQIFISGGLFVAILETFPRYLSAVMYLPTIQNNLHSVDIRKSWKGTLVVRDRLASRGQGDISCAAEAPQRQYLQARPADVRRGARQTHPRRSEVLEGHPGWLASRDQGDVRGRGKAVIDFVGGSGHAAPILADQQARPAEVRRGARYTPTFDGRGKREIPEKTRRPVASSGTIPTCKSPGATPPGIEPGWPRWKVGSLTTKPPRPPSWNENVRRNFCRYLLSDWLSSDDATVLLQPAMARREPTRMLFFRSQLCILRPSQEHQDSPHGSRRVRLASPCSLVPFPSGTAAETHTYLECAHKSPSSRAQFAMARISYLQPPPTDPFPALLKPDSPEMPFFPRAIIPGQTCAALLSVGRGKFFPPPTPTAGGKFPKPHANNSNNSNKRQSETRRKTNPPHPDPVENHLQFLQRLGDWGGGDCEGAEPEAVCGARPSIVWRRLESWEKSSSLTRPHIRPSLPRFLSHPSHPQDGGTVCDGWLPGAANWRREHAHTPPELASYANAHSTRYFEHAEYPFTDCFTLEVSFLAFYSLVFRAPSPLKSLPNLFAVLHFKSRKSLKEVDKFTALSTLDVVLTPWLLHEIARSTWKEEEKKRVRRMRSFLGRRKRDSSVFSPHCWARAAAGKGSSSRFKTTPVSLAEGSEYPFPIPDTPDHTPTPLTLHPFPPHALPLNFPVCAWEPNPLKYHLKNR